MPSPPLSPPPPPALLAQRYRLERRIAQGGMAEVWLATDMSLSRQVAIKILKSTLASDPVVAERFRREAITVARLSHPNIVAVHDTIDHDGRQAVVMQLINGKSLRQLLDEQKRLSAELTMHIGSCVAAALDAAHNAGLVHRDVKPGNILITPDGRVLLADFGIAKGLGSSDDLTSENVMMGTAKYLSPEQVRGKKLDGRADLYALGLVLYECLAGKVPFLGESDADTALARLQRDPTDLARLRATLPYGLSSLIHQLLARNPDDRPATGGELRAHLGRIASGTDDRTTTMTPPRGATVPGTEATPVVAPAAPRDRTPSRPVQPIVRAPGAAERSSASTPREGSARPINARPPVRDRTPTGGSPRGTPARQFQQKRTPSIIVVLLLLAALIVIVVLVSMSGSGDGKGNGAPSTDAGIVANITEATTAAAVIADTSGPAVVSDIVPIGPNDGDVGLQNPDQIPLLTDGDPATAWQTNCFNDPYFNGRAGVGLVVQLSSPATGTLGIQVTNAPYQLEVYTSDAESAPTDLSGWGARVEPRSFSDEPGTIGVVLDGAPARWVFVHLIQAATDPGCTAKFPYRAGVGEISFSPAP